MISKQLVTLKNDVPLKNDVTDFIIKDINDKLYDFKRWNLILLSYNQFLWTRNKNIKDKSLIKKAIK